MRFRQYWGPALVSAAVVLVVGLFVVPAITSLWDDLTFLHIARQQAIQQQIQLQQQAQQQQHPPQPTTTKP